MPQRTLDRNVQPGSSAWKRSRTAVRGASLSILVRSARATRGRLVIGNLDVPCAIGRTGVRRIKREGDGASPAGRWRLLSVHYRTDRIRRPATGLPNRAIHATDGWCDAPADRNYNRRVKLPYAASAEALWRTDSVYDIVVVLNHNTRPRIRNGGSAIFIHLARTGFTPTEGCVALSQRDLRLVLAHANHTTTISIGAGPRKKMVRR